jgi:transposase-like protein
VLSTKAEIHSCFDAWTPASAGATNKDTAVYGLPEPYRKRLRTSNSIERLNEELRRRERVIQKHPSHWTNMLRGIFPNETSMIRLMGSVLMEMHERWMTGKKPGKLCNSTVTN